MFGTQEASLAAVRQMTSAFWSASVSAQAAGVTIALRLPILFQAATDPFAWPARHEAFEATAEKWEAGMEGAFGAMLASAALWRDAIARPGDIGALTQGFGAVAEAVVQPARQRVRGNARRLSGG